MIFSSKIEKNRKRIICFLVFDPIEIWTCLAPQNDHQHQRLVNDIYMVGKKYPKNGRKIAKLKGCPFYFEMEYIWKSMRVWLKN